MRKNPFSFTFDEKPYGCKKIGSSIKRGILKSESYGIVSLKLPSFYEFMKQKAI